MNSINNWVFQEVGRIGAGVTLLIGIHRCCSLRLAPATFAIEIVVLPLLEEIAFRGMFQEAIKQSQNFLNHFIRKKIPAEDDRRAAKVFRVVFTAVVFGLLHATNFHYSVTDKILHVSSCVLGGLSMGFMREKYGSLSQSFVYHGLHNYIASSNSLHEELVLRICDLAAFILAIN